MQSEDMVKL